MAVTDYNKTKKLDIDSVSGTPTVDKAQPVLLKGEGLGQEEKADTTEDSTAALPFSFTITLKTKAIISQAYMDFDSGEHPGTIEILDSNDNILASKSDTGLGGYIFDFTRSDYSRIPENEELTVRLSSSDSTSIVTDADFGGYTGDNFDISAQEVQYYQLENSIVTVSEVFEEENTGNGDIVIDFTNISGPEDIAVYDQDGNLLDYEIEDLDTTAETGVLWCYNSWVRDGTTQAQVVYGGSSTAREDNTEGTWNNTGQNAVMVQHLNDDPLTATDSTSNNYDGTVNGAVNTTGEFDAAASFDGTDDDIEFGDISQFDLAETMIYSLWFKPSQQGNLAFVYHEEDADAVFQFFDNDSSNSRYRTRIDINQTGYIIDIPYSSVDVGNWYHYVMLYNGSNLEVYLDGNLVNSLSVTEQTDDISGNFRLGSRFGTDNYWEGNIDEFKGYAGTTTDIDSAWVQAEYDVSPKAGQIFFTQQAAETTAVTISAPASQGTSQTPNPTVTAGNVNIQVPESTATGTTPNPTVFSDQFLSAPVSAGNAATPTPTVTPGNATASMPVTQADAVTPNPSVFKAGIISAPVSQGTSQTPNPRVLGGDATISVPISQNNAVTPNPAVFSDLVINARVSTGNAATPSTTLNAGAITINAEASTANAVTPEPTILRSLGEGVSLNIDVSAKKQYIVDVNAKKQYDVNLDAK